MIVGHRPRKGRASRRIALLGALALLVALMPFGGTASADHFTGTEVIDANSAVEAAVNWSKFTFDNATHAALGRNDKFPDNLASSVIQGRLDAPLLLTDSTTLSEETQDELERLGVTTVHVLGGDAAIDESVVNQLRTLGYSVHREAGVTRIETAIDIADSHAANATEGLLVRAFGGPDGDETQAWADALAAGGWAAEEDMPVFLTQSNELNDNLRAYLEDSNITKLTVIGGTSAISAAVVAELEAMGITVVRVSGPNRFATAVEVAEARGFADAGDADTVILVEGQQSNAWASGFAAAAYSAQAGAPIVLSNGPNLPPETVAFLEGSDGAGTTLLVCGPFVEDSACDQAAVLLGHEPAPHVPATVTARPELQSAQIMRTVTSTQVTPNQDAGTYIQYTFDEPVATVGADATDFFAYDRSNFRYPGSAVIAFSNDNRTVEVRFNTPNTTTVAVELTLATVVPGAVRDLQGLTNPEGDAPIGTASSTTVTAGTTTAPDLLSVGNFRQAQAANTTAVDFVFDQAAFVSQAAGFSLVLVDNTLLPCTASTSDAAAGGGTVPGGSGTTTVTVTCAHAGSTTGQTTPLTASQVARGVVLEDTVFSDAARTQNGNPLQAAQVSPAPTTTGPDLVAAAFERDVTLTAPDSQTLGAGTYDRVTYRFDQAVTPADETDFRVYQSDADEINAPAQNATTSQDGTQVVILFPQNTLATAVGANVGDTATTQGLRDEVATANTQSQTRTPGETTGPQLTAVSVDRGTDVFNQPTAWRATYTFDSNVTVANQNLFFVYQPDGDRYQATNCAPVLPSGQTTSSQVRCTAYQSSTLDTTPPAPTANQPEIGEAMLGTVQFGAVQSGGQNNPEGAEVISGSTGTPQ